MDPTALIGGLVVTIIGGIIVVLVQKWLESREKQRKKDALVPEEVTPPKLPTPKIPNNLPQPGEFIGREREKAEVREALSSRWPLICIDGIGGIGKTALALEVARECLRASEDEVPADGLPTFDAFVWTTAKDRVLALSDILDSIARTLDYPYIARLPLEQKPSEAVKLLRAQKCLLIVDNFETITDDAVRDFLLRLPEPSKALITSRHKLLRQARDITLDGMEQDEALAFIRSEGTRLGLESIQCAEEKTILLLHQATGGNPQAIRMSVGQIKYEGLSLDAVLKRLYDARDGIFEYMFARDWELLSDDARCVLLAMPIFGPSASRAAIEAASNVHHFYFERALKQLVEMSLIDTSGELDEAKQRYSIHPLTRSFARRQLMEAGAEYERNVQLRIAAFLTQFVLDKGGYFWRLWDAPFVIDQLESEHENILRVMDWCRDSEQDQEFVSLMAGINDYLGLLGYWQERIFYAQEALVRALRLGDDKAAAWLCANALAWPYLKMSEYEKAERYARRGLSLAERADDVECMAKAMEYLARIALQQDRVCEFKQQARMALELANANESPLFQNVRAKVYADYATLAARQDKWQEAEKWLRKSVAEFGKRTDEERLSKRFIQLGNVLLSEGRLEEPSQEFTRALDLSKKYRRVDGIAGAKHGLARVYEKQGQVQLALSMARQANDVYQRLGVTKRIEETRAMVKQLEREMAKRAGDMKEVRD